MFSVFFALLCATFATSGESTVVSFAAASGRIVPPMQLYGTGTTAKASLTGTYVGSNEVDCSIKDPNGRRVQAQPTAGFAEWQVTVPITAFYTIAAYIHTPDSLSDSWWVQFDTGPALYWSSLGYKTWGWDRITPFAGPNGDRLDVCHYITAGSHLLRLYVREPGASLDYINVSYAPTAVVTNVQGCAGGCPRSGGAPITLTVANFCGPSALAYSNVTVAGRLCLGLGVVTEGVLRCTLPELPSTLRSASLAEVVLFQGNNSSKFTIPLENLTDAESDTSHKLIIGLATAAGVLALLALVIVGCVRRRARRLSMLPETRPAPEGEVALVFTNIQGYSQLWEANSAMMGQALAAHDTILRDALLAYNGYEVKTEGDSFFITFDTALEAFEWCIAVQARLVQHPWGMELLQQPHAEVVRDSNGKIITSGLRVRMGLHVGEPISERSPVTGRMDYLGPVVNRAARVHGLGSGGQVLLSQSAFTAIKQQMDAPSDTMAVEFPLDNVPYVVTIIDHGLHQLKGIPKPEHVYGALAEEFQERVFPPLGSSTEPAKEKERAKGRRGRKDRYLDDSSETESVISGSREPSGPLSPSPPINSVGAHSGSHNQSALIAALDSPESLGPASPGLPPKRDLRASG